MIRFSTLAAELQVTSAILTALLARRGIRGQVDKSTGYAEPFFEKSALAVIGVDLAEFRSIEAQTANDDERDAALAAFASARPAGISLAALSLYFAAQNLAAPGVEVLCTLCDRRGVSHPSSVIPAREMDAALLRELAEDLIFLESLTRKPDGAAIRERYLEFTEGIAPQRWATARFHTHCQDNYSRVAVDKYLERVLIRRGLLRSGRIAHRLLAPHENAVWGDLRTIRGLIRDVGGEQKIETFLKTLPAGV